MESTENIEDKENFEKFLKEINSLVSKGALTKGEELVENLISDQFLNPYDALSLGAEASEEEIKKKYRTVYN
jgi:hypothetical protein